MVAASESHLGVDTGLRPAAVLHWAGQFVAHIVEIGRHISNFTKCSVLRSVLLHALPRLLERQMGLVAGET